MSWINRALCVGLPVNWWFPERGNNIESVLRTNIACTICSICPEVENCNNTFQELPTQQRIGIWGGTNKKTKKKIQRGKTTLEKVFNRYQKYYLSDKMQNRIAIRAALDPQIDRINQWLVSEIEPRIKIAPDLSKEIREEALKKALRVRKKRKEIKDKLSFKEISLEEVFNYKDEDNPLDSMRVKELLKCFVGLGERAATQIMIDGDICLTRRMRGLGWKQREYLINHPRLR